MGFESASGVVLNRRIVGEGDLFLTLFLREMGMTFVSARGAATGKVRFGGGTEPLVWGVFSLYRNKGEGGEGKRYLRGVDVADDMLKLRGRPEALFAAVRWARLLMRHLMGDSLLGHPADDLLANLYWNMKLLCQEEIPVEAAEWRFLWRWLQAWGLAPEPCFDGAPQEIELLRKFAGAGSAQLTKLSPEDPLIRALASNRGLFSSAARHAEFFLKEV